ncbi:hypothetical protein N7492_002968 [Penicillium capsulatum]|uniref:GPI-anchored cell wall organization protein Ecm33 n=1 Tax=Penicillium capsulatum TaxID=69766 RepID=A0A9W9III9_9EURO|nr:hypothetical protein N7492_002968 [Penicillium capsulatum]KAJ6122441.1 hypothetical protein N7512_004906 [Penicillium capsulatum]
MAFLKYLLPALAATQLVFADSKCDETTIETQSDADELASCKTVKAIKIKSTYNQALSLSGVEKIENDLICETCPDLKSISADSLSSIGGNFTLFNVTTLTDLSMPKLTSIGKIRFDSVPALTSLSFDKGVDETDDVTITNTGLNSLSGITLKKVGTLNVQANNDLREINLNDLKNASGIINLSLNKDSLSVKFPNLGTAKGMNFRNISSVEVPSLEECDGEINFAGTQFKTFYAPNLTASGDMGFSGNKELTNITLPVLKTIKGGFTITRNDKLEIIDLPKLKEVSGAIDFAGTFDTVSMGSIDIVRGKFNIQSTSSKFSCDSFDKEQKSKRPFKGTYTCKEKESDPKGINHKSGTSGGSSKTGGDSNETTGAAAVNGIATPAVGVAAFFYALAQLV